jgi:hypothetical protein
MRTAGAGNRPTSSRRTAATRIAIPVAQPQPRDSAPIARYRLRAQELERVQEVVAKKLLLATESTGFRMKLPAAREAAAAGLGFTDHRSVMVRARAGGSLVATFDPKQVALQATARQRRALPLSMGNKLTEDVARELVYRLRRDGWWRRLSVVHAPKPKGKRRTLRQMGENRVAALPGAFSNASADVSSYAGPILRLALNPSGNSSLVKSYRVFR